MDFEKLGYQFVHRTWDISDKVKVPGEVLPIETVERHVSVMKDGKEVGHAAVTKFDEFEYPDDAEGSYGDVKPKWGYPTVEVDPEHRGKGLATQMYRSLMNQRPNDAMRHHIFQSQAGLATSEKVARENPRQHILLEGDDYVEPGYE